MQMSEDEIRQAEELLTEFKGDDYALGEGVLEKAGSYAAKLDNNIAIASARASKTQDEAARYAHPHGCCCRGRRQVDEDNAEDSLHWRHKSDSRSNSTLNARAES